MEETKRKLASIQKIIDIQPIEGSDFLDVATVLGWHCVIAKKDNFKVGDLVVYFEVDSLLPMLPEFEFLSKGSSPKKMLIDNKEVTGHRIKTIRLRGQISQGLVMPLSILPKPISILFPEIPAIAERYDYAKVEGYDVTEILGVYKYEPPLAGELKGKARGTFPGFIPKTDETRLQSVPFILDRYKDTPFYVAEKIDGTSATFFVKNGEFHACGRTIDWLDDGVNSFWQVAKELDLEKKMRDRGIDDRVALQGELVGPKIQKNTLNFAKPTVLFFNAYDFQNSKYYNFGDFLILMKELGLQTVPIISDSFKLLPTVDEMVTYATRKSLINPNSWAEGIVIRPGMERIDADLGRLSFKVINPEYLLKHE